LGIFFNADQICSALSRLIVHQDIETELLACLKTLAESLAIGAGIDDPDLGSLVSNEQQNRVEEYCREAQEQGALLITRGHPLFVNSKFR